MVTPLYSLDLTPSDFYLFSSMSISLKGMKFLSKEQIGTWRDQWYTSKNMFFKLTIKKPKLTILKTYYFYFSAKMRIFNEFFAYFLVIFCNFFSIFVEKVLKIGWEGGGDSRATKVRRGGCRFWVRGGNRQFLFAHVLYDSCA